MSSSSLVTMNHFKILSLKDTNEIYTRNTRILMIDKYEISFILSFISFEYYPWFQRKYISNSDS